MTLEPWTDEIDLSDLSLSQVNGRITQVVGMLIKAVLPQVAIGELCLVQREGMEALPTQVVGFTRDEVFLSPLGAMTGVGPSCEVVPTGKTLSVGVGPALLGRILDGLGRPLDEATRGPLICEQYYPVEASPPDPLKRQRITRPISVGVRAIDGVLSVGEGQRVGIFAAAGGG